MAVKIRLTRVGATKRPSYRVVAIDSRRSRDGRALEILGFYDPLTEPATVQLDGDRVNAWIDKGAKPSDTVIRLMRQAGIGGVEPLKVETTKSATKKPSKKAAAKAAAAKSEAEPVEAPAAKAETAPAEPAEAAAADAPAAESEATPAEAAETETAPAPETAEATEAKAEDE